MKQLVAALMAVAFASVALAQGSAPMTPAAKAPETSSSAPMKSPVKQTKKKKAKKTAGVPAAPAAKPAM
ncbi:MAG: hypothetical protein ABIO63_05965 [Casimicrobiaceae bacterium]